MNALESRLSPKGLESLNLIRALRELPEMESTLRAERAALDSLRMSDIKYIALILRAEGMEADRG